MFVFLFKITLNSTKNNMNKAVFPQNNTEYSPKRAIETLWKSARVAIYGPEIFEKAREDKIAKQMQCINLAYALAKEHFEGKNRKTGERYFEHLREVTNIIISWELWIKPTLDQVVIAILHDIIEDTDIDKVTLLKLFWENVANAVEKLSKQKWQNYIVSPVDRELVATIEAKRKDKKLYPLEDTQSWEEDNPWSFYLERSVYSRYYEIKENAKNLCRHDYFSQLNDLEDDILNIKFADRLHNLRTQWDPENKDKVRRKIKETKDFILPVAKIRNIKAYNALLLEVEKLELQLWYTVEVSSEMERTKHWTQIALENVES